MNDRYRRISRPTVSTCQWIRGHPRFRDFMGGQSTFLWIKGPAGSGKSVLMKHLFDETRLERSKPIVASFFFNAAGSRLERCPEGLLQSLAHQILMQNEQLLASLVTERSMLSKHFSQNEYHAWDLASLQELWSQMTRHTGWKPCTLFIDALDECTQDEVRRMLANLESLMKPLDRDGHLPLRAILSSRHYPSISIRGGLEIHVEQFNSNDIMFYVSRELSQLEYYDRITLVEAVTQKASGLFLWASLVVSILVKAADDGEPLGRLLQRIGELPKQMEALFMKILSNLSNKEKEETFNLLKWVTFSARRLTAVELLFAVNLDDGLDFASMDEWKSSPYYINSDDQILKYLRSRSRGLVESRNFDDNPKYTLADDAMDTEKSDRKASFSFLSSNERTFESSGPNASQDLQDFVVPLNKDTSPKSVRVDLIHGSVRDFLTVSGLSMLSSNYSSTTTSYCHESIGRGCLRYMELPHLTNHVNSVSNSSEPGKSIPESTQIWQMGQGEGGNVTSESSYPSNSVSFLQEAARERSESIFGEFPLLRYSVDYMFHHFGTAESQRISHAWLAQYLVTQTSNALRVWHLYAHKSISEGTDVEDILQVAALTNLGTSVDNMLIWLSADASWQKRFNLDKSLYLATIHSNDNIVLRLIRAGAQPTFSNGLGQTTFHALCRNGNTALIEACVKHGAPAVLNSQDVFGRVALHEACEAGLDDVVSKLITLGANTEAASLDGETPLIVAARSGRLSIVELLVGNGAVVEARDSSGSTARDIAAERSSEDICKFLDGHGAVKGEISRVGAGIDWRGTSTPAPPEWHIRSRDRGLSSMSGGSLINLLTCPYQLLDPGDRSTFNYRVTRGCCPYCGDRGHEVDACSDFLTDDMGCALQSPVLDLTCSDRERRLVLEARLESRCEYCYSIQHKWAGCPSRLARLKIQDHVLKHGIRGSFEAKDLELIQSLHVRAQAEKAIPDWHPAQGQYEED